MHVLGPHITAAVAIAANSSNSGPWAGQSLRAMYGLPALPPDLGTLTSSQRAALGEGQTVYLAVVYYDQALFSNLAQYSQDFGLPTCMQVTIDSHTPLPLGPAGAGCSVAVVGVDAAGNIAPPPEVGWGWTEEEALDLEMVHAMAPLARVVVVAASDDSLASLTGAIALANRMGNGVLSMSWAAADTPALQADDSLFSTPGMLYLAASGDSGGGTQPPWPAAVPSVLAVGGTSVQWNGSNRVEAAWSSSGGGVSALRAVPRYQGGYDLSDGRSCIAPSGRMTPDVAAVADQVTIYATGPQGWGYYVVSGTSAAVPVWAGILASVDGARAAAGRPSLTNVHDALYVAIGGQKSTYAGALYDVTAGTNGTCGDCSATAGFDVLTGLGTPVGPGLLAGLAAY